METFEGWNCLNAAIKLQLSQNYRSVLHQWPIRQGSTCGNQKVQNTSLQSDFIETVPSVTDAAFGFIVYRFIHRSSRVHCSIFRLRDILKTPPTRSPQRREAAAVPTSQTARMSLSRRGKTSSPLRINDALSTGAAVRGDAASPRRVLQQPKKLLRSKWSLKYQEVKHHPPPEPHLHRSSPFDNRGSSDAEATLNNWAFCYVLKASAECPQEKGFHIVTDPTGTDAFGFQLNWRVNQFMLLLMLYVL